MIQTPMKRILSLALASLMTTSLSAGIAGATTAEAPQKRGILRQIPEKVKMSVCNVRCGSSRFGDDLKKCAKDCPESTIHLLEKLRGQKAAKEEEREKVQNDLKEVSNKLIAVEKTSDIEPKQIQSKKNLRKELENKKTTKEKGIKNINVKINILTKQIRAVEEAMPKEALQKYLQTLEAAQKLKDQEMASVIGKITAATKPEEKLEFINQYNKLEKENNNLKDQIAKIQKRLGTLPTSTKSTLLPSPLPAGSASNTEITPPLVNNAPPRPFRAPRSPSAPAVAPSQQNPSSAPALPPRPTSSQSPVSSVTPPPPPPLPPVRSNPPIPSVNNAPTPAPLPPPVSSTTPPPPPPQGNIGSPPSAPSRTAPSSLLSQIQGGAQLKKVDTTAQPPTTAPRSSPLHQALANAVTGRRSSMDKLTQLTAADQETLDRLINEGKTPQQIQEMMQSDEHWDLFENSDLVGKKLQVMEKNSGNK